MQSKTDEHNLSLHPAHLADLRKSGLLDKTIQEAGIYSVPPVDISKKLEGHLPKVESLLAFPYGSEDERYKLFLPQGDVKYYQRKGTSPWLYFPSAAILAIKDATIPLHITEGEKKALKASQEGLPCLGLGGLWNWCDGSKEKNLILDFDWVEWRNRTVYLVPDNDWLQPDHHGERKNLRQAVYELAYRLIDRGAKVFIIELPEGPEKGFDDFLCNHTVEEFKALPKEEVRKLTLQEMIEQATLETLPEILKRLSNLKETERAVYVNALAKKLNIAKRAIQKDIEALTHKKEREPGHREVT